ncbi:dihydrofolate reductase [[Flexibacter] sp. ATCC 35103]|uniref:dihydrofolate reductase n=1 Tax=[Flexibacter] sp. ATCC 35103 TaxID=1937528 RepID=UPI0009CE9257|nr:dihydrofolate reductase [[Flexibacter] sp. ATCC 35103]OMQ10919.1 diacylglycerol kinase [[Flexibacter] sp. ATCC 35103]
MIIMIAAVAENNALGKNNELVWHLPNDFKRFKSLTTNHHIIMGRKTFESFPKPLPNRVHVIITRQKDYNPEGCIVVDSIENAIAACPENEDSYIIGGGEIYNLALPYTDIIEITKVHHTFEADTFFPKINNNEWQLVESEENLKDDKHLYDYTYETYIRK